MESIKSAFYALKNGVAKRKNKASAEVKTAIDEAATLLDILKNDSISKPTFLKLSDLLRHKLQPLYTHELDLSLKFTSAVFLGVYNARILKSKDQCSKQGWERILSSILSGLLDHLDANRTSKTKGPVAHAFLSTLCKLYFPTSSDGPIHAGSDLLTTVFMLLTEVICGQAPNATAIRKALTGGRRLGYAMLNLKDFLPLEAALELFANLLIAIRGTDGRSKRAKFVKEVLDPSLFDSSQLVDMLSKVTNDTLWSQAFPVVMKSITSLSMSLPQLFEIKGFESQGFRCKAPESICLESSAVVCNIPDKGGAYDTLKVLFRSTTSLSLSSEEESPLVVLSLITPPTIGNELVKCTQQDLSIQWRIAKQDVKRFIGSLRERKIPFDSKELKHTRKLSIAQEGVFFDVKSEDEPPKPTQDKVLAIAELWEGSEATRPGADEEPSSPLVNSIFPPNSDEVKAHRPPSFEPDSIFIDGDGNLTNKPSIMNDGPSSPPVQQAAESAKSSATKDMLISKALSVLMSASTRKQDNRSQESAEISQPKFPSKKRHNVILSDNESELTDVENYDIPSPTPPTRTTSLLRQPPLAKKPVLKPTATGRASRRVESKQPAKGVKPEVKEIPTRRMSPRIASTSKTLTKPEAPRLSTVKEEPDTKTTETLLRGARQSMRLKENIIPVKPEPVESPVPLPKNLKKRVTPAHSDEDDEPPLPPPKKRRTYPEPKPRPTTRYRAKMRGSTPAVINLVDDDDEPPKARAVKSGTKKEVGEPKTQRKKTAMKDKNGKPKPRPVTTNKRKTAAANENTRGDEDVEMEDVKPNIRSFMDPSTVQRENRDPSVSAQSVAKSVELEATTPHLKTEAKSDVARPSSRKPRKSAWQRDSFMEKLDAQRQSTPANRSAKGVEPEMDSPNWRAPPGAFDFDAPVKLEDDEPIINSDGINEASDTFVTEQVTEYYAPVKMGDMEQSPIPEDEPMFIKAEGEDAVMIDLTSPKTVKPSSPAPIPVSVKRPAQPAEVDAKPAKVEANNKFKVEEERVPVKPKHSELEKSTRKPEKTVIEQPTKKMAEERPVRKAVKAGVDATSERPKLPALTKMREMATPREKTAEPERVEGDESNRPSKRKIVVALQPSPEPETMEVDVEDPSTKLEKTDHEHSVNNVGIEESTEKPEKITYPHANNTYVEQPSAKPEKITHYFETKQERSAHIVTQETAKKPVAPTQEYSKFTFTFPRSVARGRSEESEEPLPPARKRAVGVSIVRPKIPELKLVAPAPRWTPPKEPVPKIEDLLGEILGELADRLNRRFDDTSRSMSQAQLALLHRAEEDLKPMFQEGADHFNALVDLEAEYGAQRRKIMTGIDAFKKATVHAATAVKTVTKNHALHGLAKKFPPKLFTKALPTFQMKLLK